MCLALLVCDGQLQVKLHERELYDFAGVATERVQYAVDVWLIDLREIW